MAPSRGSDSVLKAGKKNTKKTSGQKPAAKHDTDAATTKPLSDGSTLPAELQQRTLDCFTSAFGDILDATGRGASLKALLQEVKGHLYDRNFTKAFGREDHLEVYAARWSASRALAYIEVFLETLQKLQRDKGVSVLCLGALDDLQQWPLNDDGRDGPSLSETRIVALGGGAGAELCAIVAAQNLLRTPGALSISLVDSADWLTVVQKLERSVTQSAPISPDASAAVKAAASAPVINPMKLHTTFHRIDLLEPGEQQDALFTSMRQANLITLAFTLNELYTTSLARTQSFLLDLTAATQQGTLLLVIDSPGSYSTVTINGRDKKYPMRWLLEHTLLHVAPKALADTSDESNRKELEPTNKPSEETPALWQLLDSTPSRWFRIPEGLRYPLELENMRYQMSLLRRF